MTRKEATVEGSSIREAIGSLFGGSNHTRQTDKVREYIIHRIEAGNHLDDVVEESYVQRNCNQAEINEIVCDPRLVHAARDSMERVFDSGELDPAARA